MQGSGACWPGPQGFVARPTAKSEDGNPAFHGTVAFGNHPTPPKVSGLGVMVAA